MNRASPRLTATAYLPQRRYYWYARCKLASDPVYDGVGTALRGTDAPLLDLGCGIGLLAHTLRAQGFAGCYLGIDNDAGKIAAAQDAAVRANLHATHYDCIDLANAPLPPHRGSVALLDVLQFVPPQAASALVERAAACIAPGARLVIRSGLDDADARTRFTRTVDAFSRRVGWMNAAPKQYPKRAELAAQLARCGLLAHFAPLSGRLPFNNWLIVCERAA
ncbi:MAG: class I SAM-dependent methyltransferase [Rudaea sp.]|uniref:class I SAM-dependent methyltransferase n=1 Tax=Rudaea sp. TaxID=2136325 RepID=UPI0039E3F5F1